MRHQVKKISTVLGERGKRVSVTLHRHGIVLPHWIQGVIWLSGIITLIIVTFKYSIPIVTDYINDDTNMEVNTYLTQNEPFQPPPLVMYFPHYILDNKSALSIISSHLINNSQPCSYCSNLTEMSWDVWTKYGKNIQSEDFDRTRFTLAAAFTWKMLNETRRGINPFPDENQNWMWPLIESAMYFFSWKYTVDRYLMAPVENGTEEMEIIDNEYSDIKINGNHIYNIFNINLMRILCRTFQLGVWDYLGRSKETCEDILIKNIFSTVIDNATMWIPIPTSSMEQNNLTCKLWPWNNINYNNSIWTPQEKLEKAGEICVYSEPLPQYYWEVDNSSFWWPDISGGRLANLWPETTITYSVNMKITEKRRGKLTGTNKCYNDINPKLCIQKCGKYWAIKRCKCIPYSFHKGLDNLDNSEKNYPYCTRSNYSECNLKIFQNSSFEEECGKNCSNPCQYTSYTFHISRQDLPVNDKLGFSIILRPVKDSFIEFSLITKDQTWDFISNLGGIVNLFLGLSGLSMCIFIVSCVDVVKRYRRKRAGETITTNLRTISLWQMILQNKMGEQWDSQNSTLDDGSKTEESELEKQIEILSKEIERMKMEISSTKEFCQFSPVTKL